MTNMCIGVQACDLKTNQSTKKAYSWAYVKQKDCELREHTMINVPLTDSALQHAAANRVHKFKPTHHEQGKSVCLNYLYRPDKLAAAQF